MLTTYWDGWIVQLLGPDSVEAAGVWDAITSPPLTSVPLTMSRDAFLDAVTPGWLAPPPPPLLPHKAVSSSAASEPGSNALRKPSVQSLVPQLHHHSSTISSILEMVFRRSQPSLLEHLQSFKAAST